MELAKNNRRRFGGGESNTGLSGAAAEECQAGSERMLQEYDNRTRYVKLVIQYAYVTMFANSLPAAACLALVNNICQVSVHLPPPPLTAYARMHTRACRLRRTRAGTQKPTDISGLKKGGNCSFDRCEHTGCSESAWS